MKHLLIANKGLLEVEALTLLGASTKRGDTSKIGKFGSGNKYALAFFLRNGCKVRVYSGNTEIKLGLVRKTFREHPFDVITVNGQETSITTEFGHEWTMWQGIRELYTNAVDEGLLHFGFVNMTEKEGVGFTDELDQAIITGEETTRIYIESTKDIDDFMFNVRDYIAEGNEVIFECEYGKIYRKHNNTTCIYYKGIKCFETKKESIYDYDFNSATLNESRLLAYIWTLPQEMWKILFECNNPVIIRSLLNGIQETKFLENEIDGDCVSLYGKMPNEGSWREALNGSQAVPRSLGGYVKDEDRPKTLFLPNRLYHSLVGLFGNEVKNKSFTVSNKGHLFHKVDPDVLIEQMLKEVSYFFSECGFNIPYPIVFVEFDDKRTMAGITEDSEILLSIAACSKGKQYIANCLVEEYIHIRHGVADETRGFQDAIIDEFLTYMKSHNAFSL